MATEMWLYLNPNKRNCRDTDVIHTLRTVDLIFVPINIAGAHWHIIAIDRLIQLIIYYDPLCFRVEHFAGDPPGTVARLKTYLQCKGDEQSLFKDIGTYDLKLAHEWTSTSTQLRGQGCGIHCINFASNILTGSTMNITDDQTRFIRPLLQVLLANPELSKPLATS